MECDTAGMHATGTLELVAVDSEHVNRLIPGMVLTESNRWAPRRMVREKCAKAQYWPLRVISRV